MLDITIDGNKANTTTGVNLVSINPTCERSHIERCTFQNAKSVAGYGIGLYIASTMVDAWRHKIIGCAFYSNESNGLSVADAHHLTVRDCVAAGNGGDGITVNNYDATLAQKIYDVVISGNDCYGNAGSGIVVGNFAQDNDISGDYDYGVNDPEAMFVAVSDNICHANVGYGMAIAGHHVTVTGNIIQGNTDGMLATTAYSAITGNLVYGNTYFGIDCGFSIYCVVSGNQISANNAGLNAHSLGLLVTGNRFHANTGYGITVAGVDSDGLGHGVNYPPDSLVISGNHFDYGGGSGAISVADTAMNSSAVMRVSIVNNTFIASAATEADARACLQIRGAETGTYIRGNQYVTYWDRNLTTSGGGVVYVPEVLEEAYTNSTTTVTSLKNYGQGFMGTGVAYVTITAGGTGYTSVPTVSFSGGGGSGAAGTAVIHVPTGRILGVLLSALGTGYTSNPTVGFSGGGGSGATAIAIAAVNYVLVDRRVAITCLQAQTFNQVGTDHGILDGSGANIAVPTSGTLLLRAAGDNWIAK